jgi:hypothetical protein
MTELYDTIQVYQRVRYIDISTLLNEFELLDELLDELMIESEIYSQLKYCLGYQLS